MTQRLAILAALAVAAGPAVAHHGWGSYDAANPVTVAGPILTSKFENPCALALTGSMLFSAEASHIVLNPVFQAKMALVATGLINVAVYELGAKRAVEALPPGADMPTRARIAGFLSLGL